MINICGHLTRVVESRAVQYENVAQQVMTVASTNVNNRKLFVRGLAWETTSETLLAVCERNDRPDHSRMGSITFCV